jgi:uncharacterized protein YlaI
MKLVKVSGPAFVVTCVKCEHVFLAGNGHDIYADLHGHPFKDYYCQDCANKVRY